VVQARPALREEAPDRRVLFERLEELDAAAADGERRGLDTLVLDVGAMVDRRAEERGVCRHRRVEVGDRDADVVQP
jgi:hypothetical protein